MRVILLVIVCCTAISAQVCGKNDVSASYGFQMEGTSEISGAAQPMASIGRLVFDGMGGLSGLASVNFNGLFLGNPVTGTYEAQEDCTVSWSLQDDSGAFQRFKGKAAPGGNRIEFRQTG